MEHEPPPTDEGLYEVEVLDGEIVEQATELEPAPPPQRSLTWASPPALRVAAATATGFVAGAATFALLRRYGGRGARAAAEAELFSDSLTRRPEPMPVARSATYLVHVRQVAPPLQ